MYYKKTRAQLAEQEVREGRGWSDHLPQPAGAGVRVARGRAGTLPMHASSAAAVLFLAAGSIVGPRPTPRARAPPTPRAIAQQREQLYLPVARDEVIAELGEQLTELEPNDARPPSVVASSALAAAPTPLAPDLAGEMGVVAPMGQSEQETASHLWTVMQAKAKHLTEQEQALLRDTLARLLTDLARFKRRDAERAMTRARRPMLAAAAATWGGAAAAADDGEGGREAAAAEEQGELAQARPEAPAPGSAELVSIGPGRTYAEQASHVSFAVSAAMTVLGLGCDAPTALAALTGGTLVSEERPTWPTLVPDRNTLEADRILRNEWLLRRLLRPMPDAGLLDDARARSLRLYLLRVTRDPRALALLLARRVVELRAASSYPKARQLALALEAMQVLAPLAHGLELGDGLAELEALSLRLLFPRAYGAVADWLEATWGKRADDALEEAACELRAALRAALPAGARFELRARKKRLNSVFKKLLRKRTAREPRAAAHPAGGAARADDAGEGPDDGQALVLHDLLGIRVVLDAPPSRTRQAVAGIPRAWSNELRRAPRAAPRAAPLPIQPAGGAAASAPPGNGAVRADGGEPAGEPLGSSASAAAPAAPPAPSPAWAPITALADGDESTAAAAASICYLARDVVHSESRSWRPVENRYKDYVRSPKGNGYQAVHTTVELRGGLLMEVQLRARAMHEAAERGAAAHHMYKAELDGQHAGRLVGTAPPELEGSAEVVEVGAAPEGAADEAVGDAAGSDGARSADVVDVGSEAAAASAIPADGDAQQPATGEPPPTMQSAAATATAPRPVALLESDRDAASRRRRR